MTTTASPHDLPALARRAGALYLIPTLLAPFALLYVPSRLVAPGDAAATFERLARHAGLLRLGLVAEAAVVLAELALTATLFALFRGASPVLARGAAYARLATATLQAVAILPALAALALVDGRAPSLDPAQARALALLALEVRAAFVHVWELPFALHCALLGAVIVRSGRAPRAIGGLLALAAAGYALSGVGALVDPAGAPARAGLVALAAIVGEVPLVLALLAGRVRGVGEGGLDRR